MPTYTEKLLYGQGDARGLHASNTVLGKISGLICWEHFMPLSRQVLHNDGEFIHLALCIQQCEVCLAFEPNADCNRCA